MQVINLSSDVKSDVKRRLKFASVKKTPVAAHRSSHIRKTIPQQKDTKVIHIDSIDSLPKKRIKQAKFDTQLPPRKDGH